MAKEKGLKIFTDAKAKKTQKKIAHYLRGYRKRNSLTQKEFAAQLGYTELHYRKLESESPENTLVKSFDTIAFFAKLQNMTAVDFVSYIEQKTVESKQDLFPWEKTLLDAFTTIDVESRMAFVHGLCAKATKESSLELKKTIDLAMTLREKLTDKQIEKALDFVDSLEK